MKNRTALFLTIILISLPGFFTCNSDQSSPDIDDKYHPVEQHLPDWASVENLRLSRMDGGYIEVQKARRTRWGQNWDEEEYEVLDNIYTKYSDEIIEKLKMGGINTIWVTWSNGWSLEYESKQQKDLQVFIEKCHQNEIRVVAYICASTIFWENMLIDYPVSFDIARKQLSGEPYTYHGENPHRFLASLAHPEWINLQKQRVKLALEAGIDGFFFDNPGSANQPLENQEYFFNEIQKFIKLDKNRMDVPVFSNFGLAPGLQHMNHQLDIVYNEFGRQPGVYDGKWMSGNIKKIKFIRSFLPSWKATMHQSNYYPGGLRERVFMTPKAQKLVRAEAAAYGATYIDFVEGRLITDLVHNRKDAMDMWNAAGLYNNFLTEHAEYFSEAFQPRKILVLVPDDSEISFDQIKNQHGQLMDLLTEQNVLYNVKTAASLKEDDLDRVDLIILPWFNQIDLSIKGIIESYKSTNHKVIGIGGDKSIEGIADTYYQTDFIEELQNKPESRANFIETIYSYSTSNIIEIEHGKYVLGNITTLNNGKRIVAHIMNYDDNDCENVSVKLKLKELTATLDQNMVKAFSPDFSGKLISDIKTEGNSLDFQIPKLDTYTLVIIDL